VPSLTRDSAVPYLSTVTVAPITSTVRGVLSEVLLDETDGMQAAGWRGGLI
jgi:mRNA-degrading endonuclease toxin of MazEF toxin-antitoxin module